MRTEYADAPADDAGSHRKRWRHPTLARVYFAGGRDAVSAAVADALEHVDGYTLTETRGGWRCPDGSVIEEQAYVLELIGAHADLAAHAAANAVLGATSESAVLIRFEHVTPSGSVDVSALTIHRED